MRAPKSLGVAGKRFWMSANKERIFSDVHELSMLEKAAGLEDKIAEDEATVARDGRYVRDRFGQPREHPAAKAIRENTIVFCRIIRELGLALVAPEDSRPPRQY